MQKVWIFGDSYAADVSDESYAWPRRLSLKYNVENFAISGTGPEYILKLFRNELDSPSLNPKDLNDINLIFFLSHDSRKDFKFLKDPSDQCCMLHIASETKFEQDWASRRVKEYTKEKNFITHFYRDYYLHNNLCDFDHLKYVGILKEFSRFFKKTLVVPVFDPPHHGILHQKFDTTVEDYGNFSYAKGPALFFVENEVNGEMPNHLCIENHNRMFDQLKNWIDNSIPLDTEKLKKIR
jgi:hypothetical protein